MDVVVAEQSARRGADWAAGYGVWGVWADGWWLTAVRRAGLAAAAAAGLEGAARTLIEQVVSRAAYLSGRSAACRPRECERPPSAGARPVALAAVVRAAAGGCVHVCMCAWATTGGCRRARMQRGPRARARVCGGSPASTVQAPIVSGRRRGPQPVGLKKRRRPFGMAAGTHRGVPSSPPNARRPQGGVGRRRQGW